jgi:Domain of unknown function (DUF1929)/FlgD Ig-like domain/Galactose oxidase, central domain
VLTSPHLTSPHLTSSLVAGLVLVGAGLLLHRAHAADNVSVKGRWQWVDAARWDSLDAFNKLAKGGGTHMALVRGTADSAWIVHFHQKHQARLWAPTTPTDSIGLMVDVPTDLSEIFCSGHATLGNGKLLVVGGALTGETGEKRCVTFDATDYRGTENGWQLVDDNHQGHWYPTVTTRSGGDGDADGRVVVLGGWEWKNIVMVGGAAGSSETPENAMAVLNLPEDEKWETDQSIGTKPSARHGHSAVYWNGFNVIFGGEGSSGPTDDKVWRVWGGDNDPGRYWVWSELTTASSPRPSPRTRHAAVVLHDTLVVFGGKNASGAALGDVWRIELGATTPTWQQVTPDEDPDCECSPAARWGHTSVLVKEDRTEATMLVYGGQDESDYVDESVWELIIPREGSGNSFKWRKVSDTGPGQREGHSAVSPILATAPRTHQMIVFGGDDTYPATGGAKDDLWELTEIAVDGDEDDPVWAEVAAGGTEPAARWGHSLVFDVRGYDARFAEQFTPNGSWDKHTTQPKWLPPYPFMFSLTDGNLFFAGNGPEFVGKVNSWRYSVSAKTWSDSTNSGFLGGSAVYWPELNKVMKCGGDDDVTFQNEKKTGSAAISGGSTTWTQHDSLPESRTYHNLTQLPDGRVLLTGGRERSGAGSAFTKIPRIWDPADPGWETNPSLWLAPDLGNRGYHSTALLLPDARVLCAGGPGVGSGDWRASIYSPPYLYDATGNLAARPSLGSVLPSSGYSPIHNGEPFWVGVDAASISSLNKLALIRSGAPTHGFDQNQRYVTATFTKDAANDRLRVVLPTDHNLLPPGDYLMFVLKSNGVPSVAKWLRIQDESDSQDPGAVSNLGWVQGPTSVTVYWQTQGDDGGPTSLRAATTHELRYSSSEINSSNWGSASVLWSGNAKPAGEQQTVVLTGLDCSPLYFAVKTQDEAGRWSDLSNVAEYNCEGGGLASRRVGRDDSGEQVAAAAPQGTSLGITRLTGAAGAGVVTLDLVNVGANSIRVDSLGLVIATEPTGQVALPVAEQVVLGNRETPESIRSSSAGDVTSSIGAGQPYEAGAGEALVVQGASGATYLLIETTAADGGNHPSQTGIAVEVPSGEGWTQVGSCFPSAGEDSWLVPAAGDSVRLQFHGAYTLEKIDLIVPTSGTAEVVEARRTALEHSEQGTVDPLSNLAAGTLVLEPGERVTVGFADAGSPGAGRFLALRTSSPGTTSPARNTAARPPPAVFALSQNEPNPFGEGTLIRFALPVKSQVKLEVFDVHGRRVKTLASGEWAAGHHALEWNGRDDHGRRVGAGVYLYRMEAGSFRKSRKVVVSP